MARSASSQRTAVRDYPYVNVFDGNGDSWNFGNNYAFERTDSFSVCGYFNSSVINSVDQMAVICKAISASGQGWNVLLRTDQRLAFVLANTAAVRINKRTDLAFERFRWYFYAFTYDGSSTAAGVNLALVPLGLPLSAFNAATVITDNLNATTVNTTNLRMASRQTSTVEEFTGHLGTHVLCNAALSLAQIQAFYYDGAIPSSAQSLWLGPNTDGSGSTLTDEIGSIDGTGEGTIAGRWVTNSPFDPRSTVSVRGTAAARTSA